MKKMMIICLAAMAALFAPLPGAALAEDLHAGLKAWVWVYQPPVGPPQTPPEYQFNSKGALNRVGRLGVGQYQVVFPKLANWGGQAQVSAYGGAHYCNILNWEPSGEDLIVRVNCYAPTSALADGSFTAFFYKEQGTSTYNRAFVWADRESTDSYVPDERYQWNTRGATNSVRRSRTGKYEVFLPAIAISGFRENAGTVQVSAYGNSPARAQIDYWGRTPNGSYVRVSTYDFKGEPRDSKFTLNFSDDVGYGIRIPEDRLNMYGAYVLADQPLAAEYRAFDFYHFNNFTGESVAESLITRLGLGSYRVRFDGLKSANKSTALVSAYGRRGEYCTIGGWNGIGGTNVNVNCFNAGGEPADSRFILTYLTDETVLW